MENDNYGNGSVHYSYHPREIVLTQHTFAAKTTVARVSGFSSMGRAVSFSATPPKERRGGGGGGGESGCRLNFGLC